MKHRFTYEIMPQDVDVNRRLRLYTLENYLLNTAGSAVNNEGIGVAHLLPYGYTWVITRLTLEIESLPTHNEHITIETWVEQNAHMLSIRNYRIYHQDKLIGQATSTWVVLDLKTREIVNAFHLPIFSKIAVDGEKLSIARTGRMMTIPPTSEKDFHTVKYSDVDYNGHCNSCKYLEIMLNCQSHNVDNSCIRLDINYIKEVYMGDTIETSWWHSLGTTHYFQRDSKNTLCCTAKISKIDKLS